MLCFINALFFINTLLTEFFNYSIYNYLLLEIFLKPETEEN
ncbi:hypothetical protein SAMN05444362_101437 [Dysgonomonas macrotermitis]|uniref:Uncharacterized protein n=1 Tax=Dysgonomonas macrotermitis TaxID=1346286 RepID=A0A1M4TW72_9BACT|nr:hypothetical protein SAMN05444362_101437 [Dysgonomonas macrotermitis]